MQTSISSLRYVVFGLFITLSAVVASVAVWNLTFLQVLPATTKERAIQVDCFLIFLGCSGLVVAFVILFTDLAWRKAFTSRYWFELAWTSLWVLMELAGAIALTIVIPKQTCAEQPHGALSCRSTRILMAFTWMNTILLLLYSSLLSIHILMSSTGKNRVWLQYIHDSAPLGWTKPGSPADSGSSSKPDTVLAPRPVRPAPPISMFSYRAGLSPDYRIEHFQPPPEAYVQPLPQSPPTTVPQTSSSSAPRNSLYPEYLRSTLTTNQTSTSIATPTHREQTSPPAAFNHTTRSPLGDWPRADIMKRPSERKKSLHESKMQMMDQKITSVSQPSSSARVRPSGPRTSASHRHRPLDLSRSGPNVDGLS
ncbi:hypothetical protein L218DRAFT_204123 [Marasmius fiardii PR-910]|nr:hypothetical protein L218DRAFT_204123 [Marasmius fiardii PR-910]